MASSIHPLPIPKPPDPKPSGGTDLSDSLMAAVMNPVSPKAHSCSFSAQPLPVSMAPSSQTAATSENPAGGRAAVTEGRSYASVAAAPTLWPRIQPRGPLTINPTAPNPALAAAVPVNPGPRHGCRPRFPPLKLPNRQVSTKDGKPSISFTAPEIAACEKRYEHSIIAKFTVGRPSLLEIQKSFQTNWVLTGRASISDIWDSRHVLVILDSEEDVRTVLSSPLNKVGHAYFRLFRWSPDYDPKRESTITTIWVRLPGLPLSIYDSSFVEAIISTFGFFVSVDDRTKACSSLKFARACVELDVTKPIPNAIWINLPDNKSYWQPIEVESKLSYCNRCRVHGHSYDQCRKRRLVNRTAPKEAGPQTPTDPGVVGEVDIVESVSLEKETCVPMADESKAMVVYEGVVDDMRENPPPSTVEEGQSSQVGKSMESLAPAPAGPRTLQEYLPFIMPYLEADGIVEVPEILDEAFLEKASRAARMYRNNEPIPTVAHGEASPPLSEWIPAKKKKGKKGAHSVNESALRRSSRDRQPTSVKNSDFIYRAVG